MVPVIDFIGWDGLTPNEQLAAISGAMIALGSVLASRAVFGGLGLRRREPSRRTRHRPPSRPTSKRRKSAAPKRRRRR